MKKLLLLSAFFICCFEIGNTQPGSADSSFGNNGIVATDFGLTNNYFRVTNKNLLSGADSSTYLTLESTGFVSIAKRLSNGQPDLNYGVNGFSSPVSLINATAALDNDGKIIVAGSLWRSYETPMVIKLSKNGTVESQFPIEISYFSPSSMVIQKDGKIIITGYDYLTQFTIVRYNSDGTPDKTFSQDGKQFSDFRTISAILLQPDNKLLVAGQYGLVYDQPDPDFAIGRYNTDGSIDTTFGFGGRQATKFGYSSLATSLALKDDGKIVAAGHSFNNITNDSDFNILTCYNNNGSFDSTFSDNGKKIILKSYSFSVAVQKDGKIVTVGFAADNFELIRYNKNGTFDNTFNGNGKQIVDFGGTDIAHAIAARDDGKIVVSGNDKEWYDGDFFEVARYNTSGSPDSSFNSDGKLKEALNFNPGSTYYTCTQVQSNGKAVAAGYTFNGTDYDFAIARYNTDGSLDKGFSGDGRQTTSFSSGNDYATSMAIQKDGKIVVVGFANGYFAIVRYNTDGSLDSTFIGNTIPKNDLGPALSVAIQKDGKILVVCFGAIIVRYNTNGSLDSKFARNGRLQADFGVHQIALQSDGKIVAVGASVVDYGKNGSKYYLAVARYSADGNPDSTFSDNGKQLILTDASYVYNTVAIQNDNKIITVHHANNNLYVTRYNTDGSYDTTFGEGGTAFHSASPRFEGSKPYSFFSYPVSIQNNNKILIGGTNLNNFLLVRLLPNGNTDSNFVTNGVIVTEASFNGEGIQGMAISQNKLYAVGYGSYPGKLGVVAKYSLEDGTNALPTVSLTAPANNATYLAPAAHIKLSAAASDSTGTITKVEFYNGDKLLHTETLIPYGYVWKNVSVGNYTLTAKAYDDSGNVTTSAAVHISVEPNKPPVVSIIKPVNSQNYAVPAHIHFEASAADTDGRITRVEFYSGATLLRTEYKYPYTYNWKNVPAGTYTITAVATDNYGAKTTSAPITITVTSANAIVSNRLYLENQKTALNDALSLKISPNPATNNINIFTGGLQQNKPATISIISVSGIVLKMMRISNSSTQLNVSSLVKGVYTIKIINGDKVFYKQFVKL